MKSLRIVAATTAVSAAVAGTAGYGVALAQGGQERPQGASAVTQAEMPRHHSQAMGGMRRMHDQMMGNAGVRRHHREMLRDHEMRRLHDEMMGGRRSPAG